MKGKTYQLTLGAVFTALSLVLLLAAGYVPGLELTLYALASFLPALMIVETKKSAAGFLLYAAAAILGFVLLPNKPAIVPYLFFGLYGCLKYYIEKARQPVLQIALKLAVFLALFCSAFYLLRDLFFASISLPDLADPLIIAAAVAILFLYDAIYTGVIRLYLKKIHPHLKK